MLVAESLLCHFYVQTDPPQEKLDLPAVLENGSYTNKNEVGKIDAFAKKNAHANQRVKR
ncbi:MAG: hypothetical protein NXH97_12970 [Rhodobacteraceae bacterium]|nr:hypothetical protein [Paracoccaceae bacterium]